MTKKFGRQIGAPNFSFVVSFCENKNSFVVSFCENKISFVVSCGVSFYENISRAINDRDELAITPESCKQTIAIIEAARASAFTGEIVKLK